MLPLFLGSDEIKHLMTWILRKLGQPGQRSLCPHVVMALIRMLHNDIRKSQHLPIAWINGWAQALTAMPGEHDERAPSM